MGMESIVYGCIQGPHWCYHEEYHDVPHTELSQQQLEYLGIRQKLREKAQRNLVVIARLPEEDDEWPFLSRAMFASSTPSIQTTYKSQIIHFGASFKSIEWNWEEWLTKFEALLSNMYWDEVRLHLISEMFTTSFHYTWEDKNEEKAIYSNHPDPVASWTFSGEPRTFLPFLRKQG